MYSRAISMENLMKKAIKSMETNEKSSFEKQRISKKKNGTQSDKNRCSTRMYYSLNGEG